MASFAHHSNIENVWLTEYCICTFKRLYENRFNAVVPSSIVSIFLRVSHGSLCWSVLSGCSYHSGRLLVCFGDDVYNYCCTPAEMTLMWEALGPLNVLMYVHHVCIVKKSLPLVHFIDDGLKCSRPHQRSDQSPNIQTTQVNTSSSMQYRQRVHL